MSDDGGPAEFARKRSRADADKPIDPTYISQTLNGHRSFGERAAANMIQRAGLPADYFDPPRPPMDAIRETRMALQLMDYPSDTGPREFEIESLGELDDDSGIVGFARKRSADHPAIEEVIRLMLEMEDNGKWILAGEARQLVKQHPVHKKQVS